VIFSGVLAYPPNIAAVTWFAGEVWPQIRAAEPRARFVVAGRTPVMEVRALDGRDGIEVRGDVPDMRAELEQAWVAVAPMRSGTGIKNKVLEAWAAAKPGVMTRVASNGLALDEDAASLITDGPAAFAACVVQLLRDSADRVRLGRAAHALARDRHGWGDAAERLHQLLAAAARG
jgi:glycosyltransferase involved in cell wall biosynthesis